MPISKYDFINCLLLIQENITQLEQDQEHTVWKDKTIMPLSAARWEHISEDPFILCSQVPWVSFGKAAIWCSRQEDSGFQLPPPHFTTS